MCVVCVCGVCACVCRACGVEPHGKGPRKPRLRIMGLNHLEEWKVPEREPGSETGDGGREGLEQRLDPGTGHRAPGDRCHRREGFTGQSEFREGERNCR